MKYIPVLFLVLLKTTNAQNNVAVGGIATHIDSFNELGAASNAIDGNKDSEYSHGSCSHTFTPTNPWWRVDLRGNYVVTAVAVTNRGDCCADRLNGAQIRVGKSLVNNGNDNEVMATIASISSGETKIFSFANPVVGRYVNVYLPGTEKYLTLCEVEVYGFQAYENVAVGGIATQIDTYNEFGAASNAIDGNKDSEYSHSSCSHTLTPTNPWWRVDLRGTHVVTAVAVTNRGDCCADRLDGAEIRVGKSLVNNGNNNEVVAKISHIPLGETRVFIFYKPEGRYVTVYLPGTDKYLSLCELEVYGYPTYDNVALGGIATQIDSYNEFGAASNAIDGNKDSDYSHGSCSHTFTTTNPWWRVDLQSNYVVTSVAVTNRGDCCADRLDGAEIRVGKSNIASANALMVKISHIALGDTQTFTFPLPVVGRYVNVDLPGTDKYLSLCEVQVHGYPAYENVAVDGIATHIDSYNELGAASNAIDGNKDSDYSHGSCSHTLTPTNPWWRVDLRVPHVVTAVAVTNRGDCCADRLDGAEIRVGQSLVNNGNDNDVIAKISQIPLGETRIFTFSYPVEGRYVNVYLPGTDKYLSLCEVEVYGYQRKG